nr:uncharacterized protein LOC110379395 [Helicoverpa armigera]
MFLITKLLFVAIVAIASSRFEVAADNDDLEDEVILKQALFLVELLKSDFVHVLRTNSMNDLLNGTSTEEVNSTCAVDETNSTVPTNDTNVTESVIPPTTTAANSTPPSSVTPPGAPMMMFSSWPPLQMPRFPMAPALARQGNFPDENYRFPYKFRRRMMPDYYYFDSPQQRPGNFRRVANIDSTGEPGNATATAPIASVTGLQVNLSHTAQANAPAAKESLLRTDNNTSSSITEADKSVQSTSPLTVSTAKTVSTVDTEPNEEKNEIELEVKNTSQATTENIRRYNTTKIPKSGTLKIFLGKSSKLPVPLPENNAFCYFHPNNPLCGNA